jgi:8-oxo-dGTP pyrophosphatase MutT (NUDIX family)
LRELAEETGCRGVVRAVGPFVYNSPGLTDEKVSLVQVEVTSVGRSRPEADEAIEVVWAPLRGLVNFLRTHEAAGTRIDAKLWCLAQGMSLSGEDAEVAAPA